MKKRIFIISFLLASLAIYATAATAAAAFMGPSKEAVSQQSSYSITLEKSRGIIYDRELLPLTNSEAVTKAVCFPTEEVFRTLKFNSVEKLQNEELMEAALPFTLQVSHILDRDGITYYESAKRYSGICPHIIGYCSENKGISGAELIFEEQLKSNAELKFVYSADALGKAIPEGKAEIIGSTDISRGIALTIDRDIQLLAEEAAELLDKGAVVVMDVASSDILACVSRPDFDPDKIVEYIYNPDSPLMNRAMSAYTPGSVFKLIIAAAALENGLDPKAEFICRGSYDVDGMDFHCYNKKAHGKVNLHTALQNSCNCYFIDLAAKLKTKDIYTMALSLGLGSATELYPGFEGDSGSVGSIPALSNPRALANFAIGQGEVQLTPLQAAALVGSIARGGVYSIPNILCGFVDNEKNLIEKSPHGEVRVLSPQTTKLLRDYMESTVKFGTGKTAYSEHYHAGAKTGTAQTGIYEGGKEKLNYWFCGYVGKTEVPEYVIIVLREGASDENNPCPEVFRMIAEGIFAL